MSDINITPNSPNTVTIQNADNIITVTDTSKHTEVDITQEITDIVNVVTPGPQGTQGIQGPAGQGFDKPFTGSLIISGSIEVIGDQTISGSLTISGSSTFTNIGPAIFSGSVTTTQGFTGSLSGTASYADMATTASHALFAVSASHEVIKEVSSSHANTADIAGGLQGQPSIYVTNITASSNISSSANIFATSFTGIFNGALSSSAQIASDISGAFASPFTAAGISGSFNAASSSFSTRVTTNETNITTLTAATSSYLTSLPSGVLSSSAQIATNISGAFGAASSSFSTRITANEIVTSKTLISSSAQIASNISGAFSATSSSLASRTSTLETKTSYSGSFSGSFEGNGSGLTNIPAAGIVGLNLSQIASGSATASISPNLGLVVNTNVSSSATSTASFGTYLGDGSQLSNISTTPFPFTGDAQITGSLTISGSFHSFTLDSDNIVLGSGAGSSMEAGANNNVILGMNAGDSLTTGDVNVLIGQQAGQAISTTGYNVILGRQAGYGITGQKNIIIGTTAGYGAGSGDENVIIGQQAGYAMSGDANRNVLLGTLAGRSCDANDNIMVGYYAGWSITSGDGNIFIGSGSLGEAATTNQLRIGNGNNLVTISASLETGDIILQGNVSSSATSTASFGTYLGDGSQLSGISSGGGGATEEFVWFMA